MKRFTMFLLAIFTLGVSACGDDSNTIISIDPVITGFSEVVKRIASDGAINDYFGQRVAISGDTAIVGSAYDDDNANDSGSAYIFYRNQGGADNWGYVTKITASDAFVGDNFGYSVAISGDTAIVSAISDNSNAGSVYIFYRDKDGITDSWGEMTKISASDAAAGDEFGYSVAISGNTAIVGARYNDDNGGDSGSAYIFYRNEGGVTDSWGEATKIVASDAAAGHWFGYSVAISGDTAIVGAMRADSAYIFDRNQGGTDGWGEVTKITASDGTAGDQFGYSVAISGDTAIVGADYDDDNGNNSGSAFIFDRNQGGTDGWGEVTKITAADGAADDRFGQAVAISGDYAIAGAAYDDDNGADSGSAYIFSRNWGGADSWGEVTKVTAADGAAGDRFGLTLAISGNTAIVSAMYDADNGANSGSVYLLEKD